LQTVTVSSKYQVVIPRAIRRSLRIEPGQKVQVFLYGDRIEFVPAKPMRRMRGFLKGIDTAVERDADRV
jgi:AbrB family looped-hinge helix DNA binding protein